MGGPLQTPPLSRAQSRSAGRSGEGPGGGRTPACGRVCTRVHAQKRSGPGRARVCVLTFVCLWGVSPLFRFSFPLSLVCNLCHFHPFLFLFFLSFYSVPSPSLPLSLSSCCVSAPLSSRLSWCPPLSCLCCPQTPPSPPLFPSLGVSPRLWLKRVPGNCKGERPGDRGTRFCLTQARLVLPAPRRRDTPRAGPRGPLAWQWGAGACHGRVPLFLKREPRPRWRGEDLGVRGREQGRGEDTGVRAQGSLLGLLS